MNKYLVDLPYPSLEGIKPSDYDLRLIMQDFAGMVSEVTAVHQYFYNHLYANQQMFKEIGETIMGIAIAEMHHLDILGEVILKLGGNPKLIYPKQCSNSWWSGNLVNYQTDIRCIIESAIISENQAIDQYMKHAQITRQKSICDILSRIILDEQLHLQVFNNILMQIC